MEKKLLIWMMALSLLFTAGCAGGKGVEEDTDPSPTENLETEVSDMARRVIEAMFDTKNEELNYHLMMFSNVQTEQAQQGIVTFDIEQYYENWETAVGDCFSPGALENAHNNCTIIEYHVLEAEGISIDLVNMERTFLDKYREEVLVTFTADGAENQVTINLRINTDGLFYKIELDPFPVVGDLLDGADEDDWQPDPEALELLIRGNDTITMDEDYQLIMHEYVDGERTEDWHYAITASVNDSGSAYRQQYDCAFVSQADWSASAAGGDIIEIADNGGNSIQCTVDSLIKLQLEGETYYLRTVYRYDDHSYYQGMKTCADAAAMGMMRLVTVDGSITDLEQVAWMLEEQMVIALQSLPDWVTWKPLNVKSSDAEERVFDVYRGQPVQFCCNLGFRIGLDDPMGQRAQFWQTGSGLGEPEEIDGLDYYGWGRECLIMQDEQTGRWYIRDWGTGGYSVNLPGYTLSYGMENYLGHAPVEAFLDMLLVTEGFTHDYLLPHLLLEKPEEELASLNDALSRRTAEEQQTICAALADYLTGEYAVSSQRTMEELKALLDSEYHQYLE